MTSVGIDLVRVSRVAESLAQFGERFLQRVFTDGEVAYARSAPSLMAERLAARFAAKEAAVKALGLERGELAATSRSTRAPSGGARCRCTARRATPLPRRAWSSSR